MCMITPLWSKLNMDLILGGSRCTISATTSSIIWAFTHNNINMSQIRGSWVACLLFPVLLETEELLLYLEKVKYILAESTERSLNWALEAVFIIVELRSARQKQWGLWLGSTEHAFHWLFVWWCRIGKLLDQAWVTHRTFILELRRTRGGWVPESYWKFISLLDHPQ